MENSIINEIYAEIYIDSKSTPNRIRITYRIGCPGDIVSFVFIDQLSISIIQRELLYEWGESKKDV